MSSPIYHTNDFMRFAHQVKLPSPMFKYVNDCHSAFRMTCRLNEGFRLTERGFAYWPKGYTDNQQAYLSFQFAVKAELWPHFEPHPYEIRYGINQPADKIAQWMEIERQVANRSRVNCSLMLCHIIENELWKEGPTPSPIQRVHVCETPEDRLHGLELQFMLEHDVHPEPWEEGSFGYDT